MTVLEQTRQTRPAVRVRPGLVLTALVLAVSVVLLGTTILNVALPQMTAALSLSNTAQQWVLNSYTLTFAGFLLIAGSIGNRFGLRETLLIGLIGFTITTGLACIPVASWFLIAARALMGVFAAIIMPTTLAIILRTFPADKRGAAISIWAGASGISISAGPLLGGALLSAGLWWGSVLALTAVISLIALIVSWVGVHRIPTDPDARLRILPVIASIVGIALLMWGVLNGGEHGDWLTAGTLVPLVIGVLVLAGLVIAEARSPHPVADVRLFRRASFTVAVIALLMASFAIYGYMYITTFFLEVQLGYTPFQTGLIFIPLSVGVVIGSPLAHRLSIGIGARATIVIGLLLATIGLGALAFMGRDTALAWILAEMLVVAFGFGLLLTPATSLATTSLPAQLAAGCSALMNTLRQIASALGVAILGSLLWSTYGSHLAPALTGVPASEQATMTQSLAATLGAAAAHPQFAAAHPQILEGARTAFDTAMHLGALVAAGTVLLAAIITMIVRPARVTPHESD